MVLGVLLGVQLVLLGGCDDAAKPDESAKQAEAPGRDAAKPGDDAAKSPAADAGYPCPTISDVMIDAPVPADRGLLVDFDVPQGFVYSDPQSPLHGDVLQLASFELAFEHTGMKRHQGRKLILEIEQAPELGNDMLPLPPTVGDYVMGSGGEALPGDQLAGTVTLAGVETPIRRAPGRQTAKFQVRLPRGDKFREISIRLTVVKTSPVVVGDMDGEACVADFDRIGLAVAKSLVAR